MQFSAFLLRERRLGKWWSCTFFFCFSVGAPENAVLRCLEGEQRKELCCGQAGKVVLLKAKRKQKGVHM